MHLLATHADQWATVADARLEADGVLSTFARQARTLEIADEPERLLSNTLRGWVRLPVRIPGA